MRLISEAILGEAVSTLTAAEIEKKADYIAAEANKLKIKNIQLTGSGPDGQIRALTRMNAFIAAVKAKNEDREAIARAVHKRGFNVRF